MGKVREVGYYGLPHNGENMNQYKTKQYEGAERERAGNVPLRYIEILRINALMGK